MKLMTLILTALPFLALSQTTGAGTIYQEIKERPQFSTLTKLLNQTGLSTQLNSMEATRTLFAPTDAAFAKIPEETLNIIASDLDALQSVLKYHLLEGKVPGQVAIGAAISKKKIETLNGENIQPSFGGIGNTDLKMDESFVTKADLVLREKEESAINGSIHEIDSVLLPKDLKVITFIVKRCTRVLEIPEFDTNISGLYQARVCEGKLKSDNSFSIAIFQKYKQLNKVITQAIISKPNYDETYVPNSVRVNGLFVEELNLLPRVANGAENSLLPIRVVNGKIEEIGYNEPDFLIYQNNETTYPLEELRGKREFTSYDLVKDIEAGN